MNYTNRHLSQIIPNSNSNQLVLLTGARQTGKTTLTKHHYPNLPYFNLDAPEIRDLLLKTPTTNWPVTVKEAILDEIQKAPQLFEKIKFNYDEGTIHFSVLTGSSQILLLKKVSESLAGRVSIYELFPLMLSELLAAENKNPSIPLIDNLLNVKDINEILKNTASIFGAPLVQHRDALSYLARWGGMPKLRQLDSDDQRYKWLRDYEYAYLQRDLSDLARLDDLEPFRRFQKLSALRTANLLNYSELARDAGISTDTAKRYLEYLKISYQVVLLQPYYRNLTSSTVKTPKLYWLDMGILRSLTNIREGMTGDLFENMIISEIIKWTRSMQRNVELFFYRTHSGAEVDCILKTEHGIIGIEIKSTSTITEKHTKTLQEVGKALGEEWLGGIIIYNGDIIQQTNSGIWYIPAWRFFS